MIDLRLGDCLEVMGSIPDGSIDLILTDLPYGTTSLRWDVIIPFEPLWAHYRRLLKPRGAVILTASQPFTSMLVMSNREWFKYCWVWEKTMPCGAFVAKNRPLVAHEDICVFSPGSTANRTRRRMTYYPQGVKEGRGCHVQPGRKHIGANFNSRPSHKSVHFYHGSDYPKTIVRFSNHNAGISHPTQKPVDLFEYLIRTYSTDGDTVLDSCMGSGTTGVACLNTNRNFVGIEKDSDIFTVAERRIAQASEQPCLALA